MYRVHEVEHLNALGLLKSRGQAADSKHALLQQVEEAKLLWAQGQRSMAVRIAKTLAATPGQHVSAEMRARLLCLAGKWLTQSRWGCSPHSNNSDGPVNALYAQHGDSILRGGRESLWVRDVIHLESIHTDSLSEPGDGRFFLAVHKRHGFFQKNYTVIGQLRGG